MHTHTTLVAHREQGNVFAISTVNEGTCRELGEDGIMAGS